MSLTYGAYFDQDYYENGHLKGTAYHNYRNTVQQSKDYADIAERLVAFFAPRRVLEIGCGMGQIGRHFERLNVEYVGSEVADYCVANRLCEGVFKHDEVTLPFPDGHFDLVFGCHSIEHFPEAIFRASLREHLRVTRSFYGHFLPIVGPPPFFTAEGLKKDPTHFQLRTRDDWIEQILSVGDGLTFLDLNLPMRHEELFHGQLWFSPCGALPVRHSYLKEYRHVCGELLQQIAELKSAQTASQAVAGESLRQGLFSLVRRAEVGPSDEWADVHFAIEDGDGRVQQLILASSGIDRDCAFRIALVGGKDYEADYWFRTSADVCRPISLADFTVRRGGSEPRFARIDIGGPRFPSRVQFALVVPGVPLEDRFVETEPQPTPTLAARQAPFLPSPATAKLWPPYRLSRGILRRLRRLVDKT